MVTVLRKMGRPGTKKIMAQDRIKSRKYLGVFYRESTVSSFRGKPDRTYMVCYRDARGRLTWFRVGKASQGITEEFANRKRIELVNLVNLGENPDARRKKATATLEEVFAAFIETARLDGKHTIPEISRFDRHIRPAFGRTVLEAITDDVLTRRKAALLEKLSPASVKQIFALMRRVINFGLRKRMWRGVNPIGPQSDFSMPRVENKGERFLTREESAALLEELEKRSPQVHDMALVALRTGLRATEIFDLRGHDLDPATSTIYVEAKGGKRHAVFADSTVMDTLRSYGRSPSEHIFQTRSGGRLKETYAVFQRAVDAVRLNEGVTEKSKRVWFHVLRHTAISMWAQSGKFTLLELKEAARHERIETTMRYAHLIPGSVNRKLAAIAAALHNKPEPRHE